MLDVHKIHIILGKFGGVKVLDKLSKLMSKKMISNNFVNEYSDKVYIPQDNDKATKRVKQTLNYFVLDKYKSLLIDKLMNFFTNQEQKDIADKYYMTSEQISEMSNQGMVIGSHTISHQVMSKLKSLDQETETKDSFKVLDQIIGRQRFKTFCYPYGGWHSFTTTTENLLIDNKVDFSFNVENTEISKNTCDLNLQALPRFDCNYFPHGKSELTI